MRKRRTAFFSCLLAVILVLTDIPVTVTAADIAELFSTKEATTNVTTIGESPAESQTAEDAHTEAEIISELPEKRDDVTKYFSMSDGTIKACVYPQNVHYLKDGVYEEIDNTLVKSSKDGKNYYENKKNSFTVKIPETFQDEYVEFSDENGYVKFKLAGASNKKVQKAEAVKETKNADVTKVKNVNDRAVYKAVKGDVDIAYDLAGNKLKETIILSKKTKQSFVFDVKTSAAKVVVNNDNSISFFDKEGTELYQMQAPYMSDATGEYSNAVHTKLEKSKGGYTLTYTPDYKWLSEKERLYPVTIDPTLIQAIYKETVTDTYAGTMQTASNPDIRGGWDVLNIGKRTTRIDGQQIVMRGYIKFAIPSEIGANDCIVDAKLDLLHYTGGGTSVNGTQIDVHELTSSFSEGNTWWGNQPSYDPIITDYAIVNTGNYFAGSSFSHDSYNLTRLVNKWHNGGTNHGIVLKYHNDNTDVSTSQQVFYFAKQSVYYGSISKFVEITYRNTTGLEDYWSYTTQDMGRYGTGYVNNYNGNLVYVHDDVTFNSGINGFTLSHVYNSCNLNKTYPVNAQAGYYGTGWRLNPVPKLEPVTVTGYSNVKYKYTDGDGTEHYLVETSDGKIVDEDGLGYTYEDISGEYLIRKLTTKDGTVLKFDCWNYLRYIIDPNGNAIVLEYSPIPNVDNHITSITTTSGGTFALEYDSNYNLTSIKDNAGRKTLYRYNSGDLTEIQYPDGTVLKLGYSNHRLSTITSPDNSKICYEYNAAGKVKKTWTVGTDQSAGNCYQFAYEQNQTRIEDSYDKSITYQFDTMGRPVCVYDSDGNAVSQSYTSTSMAAKEIFKNNRANISSNQIVYTDNLINDGSFNKGLAAWETDKQGASTTAEVTNNVSLLTQQSIKLSASEYSRCEVFQRPQGATHSSYTVTAYVKLENVQSESQGAAIEVRTSESRCLYSEYLTGTTDAAIDNGFTKLTTTFTLNAGETLEKIGIGLYDAKGILYVDCVQLEAGDTSNPVNLLSNSGFEKSNAGSTTPSYYTSCINGSVSSLSAKEGNKSFRIDGVSTEKIISFQTVYFNGKQGDAYSFGAWGKANAVPNHEGKESNFKIVVQILNHDGSVQRGVAEFNEHISDWQLSTTTVIAEKPYYGIHVFMGYYNNCNTAYFDNLFLYRDTAQSYTYDSNGNVVSTADYASQHSGYEYSNNHLAKILNPTGTGYEYAYDAHKNMINSRSSEGLSTDITYDSQGNPVGTVTGYHNYSAALQSGKTYYIRLKNTGKYLSVENASTQNFANVQQEEFTGALNQKWILESAPGGGFYLHPAHATGMSLHITNSENYENANVAVYSHIATPQQIYKIIPQSDYAYKMIPNTSPDGKVVSVEYSSSRNNVTILSPQGVNNAGQSWYFEDADIPVVTGIESGAVYQFRARNSGKYLNIKDGSTQTGTAVQQSLYNHTGAQKYVVDQYGDTEYYTFTSYKDKTKLLEMSSEVNGIGYKYLRLGDSTITDSKLFKLEYNAAMQGFYIIPKANEMWALDVANYSIADGADLIFTGKQAATNRFFIAERLSDTITSSATYQNNGNYLHTVTDTRGNTTTYTYDTSRGLQTGVTDAKGDMTEYTYNSKNDRLETVKTGDSVVKYLYNTVGTLKNITSPSGTTYHFNYDTFGRQSKISVGSQMLSETIYRDNYLPLVSRFNYGNGVYKNYSYDNQNRLISESVNELTSRMYLYDKSGNLAEINDLLANVATKFQYDLIGRVIGIKASDGQNMRFVYDKYNRLSLSKWTMGDVSLSNGYIYGDSSVAGQKNGLIYGVNLNGVQKLGYAYDELSRLQSRTVSTATPFVTEYTYLEGQGSNTTTTLVKTIKNGSDTLEYTYDALGNITTVSRNGIVIAQYTYDALNQLKSAVYGEDTYRYFYDDGGNLTEIKKNNEVIKSYSYGNNEWKDLLTSFNGEIITYDAIGNPLNYRNGMSFTWQNGRQLAGIAKDGAELASYTYNAEGQRTSKTVNGVTTDYYWLNGTLQGQKTGEEYLFFLYDENGNAYGFITKNGTGESTYYYEFNVQGDIIGIIDSTGTKVVEYTYGAWGDLLSVTGTLADTIGQMNLLRYRGYYYDSETGLYYVSSRYYDPEIGRWISPEPNVDYGEFDEGSEILGYNVYAYCFNNPVNNFDPDGEAVANIVGGVIGGVSGAALGYLLADALGLKGWKKWALISAATVGGAVLGAFLGPYVAKLGSSVAAKLGIKSIPKLGSQIGRLGKLVKNTKPAIKGLTRHGLQRMAQRGVSQSMARNIVRSGHAIAQSGGKTLFFTQAGVVVLNKAGEVVTAYSSKFFDAAMKEIIRQFYG